MDPVTLTAISHVAQAAKAVATATVSGPIRRLTLRRRVAFSTSRQARRHGLRIGYRPLFKWLNAATTREQIEAHTSDSMSEAVQALSDLLPGSATAQRDADALVVLKLVLSNLLAKSSPSEAVAQSREWLTADLAAEFTETRLSVERSESHVLRRLDARDRFELNVQMLPPRRQAAATELKTDWPAVEQCIEQLVGAGHGRAEVLRQWSRHTPDWLRNAPVDAYVWLGLTASDYGAHNAAVTFLDAALQGGAFPRAHVVARKAIALSASDTEAALQFLRQGGEVDPLCQSLVLIFEGDLDRARSELEGWTTGSTEEEAIRGVLLTQVLQNDDPHAALVVALDTWQNTASTGAGLLAARLLLARAEGGGSASKFSDTQQAAKIAVAVRDIRRAWSGDSAEAVEVAVAAAHLSHDPARAWRLTQGAPDGEATEVEAADPRVRQHAALTAALRGDIDTARVLGADIDDRFHRAHVEAVIAERSANEADALHAWLAAWEAAGNDAQRLQAASGIATSGGALPDLADVETRHPEAVSEIRLVAEVLVADDPIAALRANMLRSRLVLVELAERYEDGGRYHEAGDALRSGAEKWEHPELMGMAASSYHKAGLYDLARDTATRALVLGGPEWSGRPTMLALLVEVEARSENWPAAVTVARQLIDANPEVADAYWALIRCQVAAADWNGAWASLQSATAPLAPRSRDEASVWLQLNARYSSDQRFLGDALVLMRKWHDDAELFGYFLQWTYSGLLRDELEPTPDDLNQLHELTREYLQQHPESTTFRSVNFGPDDDPLRPLADELRQEYERTEQVREKVAAGQWPLAALATPVGRSLTEASLRRAAGVVFATEGLGRADEASIAELVQATTAVIDPTVAHTLILLDAALRDQLLGSVRQVTTTDALYRDALQAQDSLALRSPMHINWDPDKQRPMVIETDQAIADLLAERSRDVASILAAVARFPHNQLVHFPKADRRMSWLSGIDLAKTRGWAYWSDDKVMRQLAASIDVPTFGTTAVLDCLATNGRLSAERIEVARATLVRNFYVDLGFEERVFELAAIEDQWRARGTAFVISRASSWAVTESAMRFVLTAIGNVVATSPEDVAGWCQAACTALIEIAGNVDAASHNLEVFLRRVAAQRWFGPATLPFVLQGVRAAMRQSVHSGALDPFANILAGLYRLTVQRTDHTTAAGLVMGLVAAADEQDRALAARVILTDDE